MPERIVGQMMQRTAGQLADIHGQQLKQLQEVQRTQASLAIQRNLREMDQLFMSKIHEQFSNAAEDIPVTEDWLDLDFRNEQMRKMFEARMDNIRGIVSTPAGRVDLDQRAEVMWQQYEQNWVDKSIAAMQAFSLAASERNFQDMAEDATPGTADATWGFINRDIRALVASESLPAHLMGEMLGKYKHMIYDGVIRRFIADPTDEQGTAYDMLQFDQAYQASLDVINKFAGEGTIRESHAQDLRQTAAAVREQVQQAVADGYTERSFQVLRFEAARRVTAGRLIELDYAQAVNEFQQDEAYGLITDKQKNQYAVHLMQEINRLNQSLTAEGSAGDPAVRHLNIYRGSLQEASDQDRHEALRQMSAAEQGEDPTLYDNAMQAYTELSRTDPAAAAKLFNDIHYFNESYKNELHKQIEDPFAGQDSIRRMFAQVVSPHFDPNTPIGRMAAWDLREQSGVGPGRRDRFTDDDVRNWARGFFDTSLLDVLKTGILQSSAVTQLGREGFSMGILAEGVAALSASDINAHPIGWAMTEIARDYAGMVTRTGEGKFDADALRRVVEKMVYDPGVDPKELSESVKKFAQTLYSASALFLEGVDVGGAALMGVDDAFAKGYEIADISWDDFHDTPIFTIQEPLTLQQRDAGVVAHTRSFQILSVAEDPELMQLQILQRRATGEWGKIGAPMNYSRFYGLATGRGTDHADPPSEDQLSPAQRRALDARRSEARVGPGADSLTPAEQRDLEQRRLFGAGGW